MNKKDVLPKFLQESVNYNSIDKIAKVVSLFMVIFFIITIYFAIVYLLLLINFNLNQMEMRIKTHDKIILNKEYKWLSIIENISQMT